MKNDRWYESWLARRRRPTRRAIPTAVIDGRVIDHGRWYYARENLHPGLIIIVPGQALLEQQEALFATALTALEAAGDLVNKVMDVLSDGSVRISDLPVTPA